jgi:hypothetical protein
MQKSTEIFTRILNHMDELRTNHEAASGGNKAAARRARKAAGEIKKLATPYKQASIVDHN